VRPVCGACVHRNSTCTFQSLPGLTRTAALKFEVAQLRMDTNNLLELYRQLRDGSAVDAWNLVEKIRSGEAPIDVPRRLDAAQGSICKPSPRPTGLVEALDPAINRYISTGHFIEISCHKAIRSLSDEFSQGKWPRSCDRGTPSRRPPEDRRASALRDV
jgi:hypothetical protein